MWLTKSSLFPVTVKPRFPKKSCKAVTFHFFFFFFFYSSQYALHPWFNFLLLFGLTIASKCEHSLPLRHDWTSAPGKLPFWPERDVIGHDLVSYPTWRRLSANSGIKTFSKLSTNWSADKLEKLVGLVIYSHIFFGFFSHKNLISYSQYLTSMSPTLPCPTLPHSCPTLPQQHLWGFLVLRCVLFCKSTL